MSVHRKFTKDYNSYGYRIGIMYDVEGAELKEVYKKIANNLSKLVLVENNKIKIQMESLEFKQLKGYACEVCGKDTLDKNFKLCKECYFKK